jgi:predicted RND superfamily exporter protein
MKTNKLSKLVATLLLTLTSSTKAGTILFNCNNQDVVLFEPQVGEAYLEIPDIHFTAEYIGAKIEGNVKTMKFLGMLDRTKVELILVKGGSITLKHYTEYKCELVDSNVK